MSATQGSAIVWDDPEPWPEPVGGAALLDEVVAILRRFVVLPEIAAVAVALWVLLGYCLEHADHAPRLALKSPTFGCGKTRLMMMLAALVWRPKFTSGINPAGIFRIVDSARPTLLVDEVDNARLRENPELKGVLNSGHTRGATFIRCEGERREPREFRTFCLVALAGIGEQPPPVTSRAIVIDMKRKPRGLCVPPLRERKLYAEMEPLRRKLARWALDNGPALAEADPVLPEVLDGRVADNWVGQVALADIAGGAWPARARRAALTLSGEADGKEGGDGELLLADIFDLFTDRGVDRLSSTDMVAALAEMEHRRWPEFSHGKAITAGGVARLLKPFGIEPGSVRFASGNKTRKGYYRDQFEDAFSRYLPPRPAQPAQSNNDAGETAILEPARSSLVPDEKDASDPHQSRLVPAVPDKKGVDGANGLALEQIEMLDRHGWTPAPGVSFPGDRS